MSQKNVEIVRAALDAFIRGDVDASLAHFSDEAEFFAPPDVTGSGRVWHGREGVSQGVGDFVSSWADFHYEDRELVASGDEVLVEGWQRGRGKGSGIEVSESIYSVWTVRGEYVVRLRIFRERSLALEAAGLSE
ncbi:MAG: SnoaL-like domain [Solirubrobacterales bacterium]|jgi:ketosteroid isomerase-like protein|nr:SnoaL-like domain [Solirubrobacterales bacterium]